MKRLLRTAALAAVVGAGLALPTSHGYENNLHPFFGKEMKFQGIVCYDKEKSIRLAWIYRTQGQLIGVQLLHKFDCEDLLEAMTVVPKSLVTTFQVRDATDDDPTYGIVRATTPNMDPVFLIVEGNWITSPEGSEDV